MQSLSGVCSGSTSSQQQSQKEGAPASSLGQATWSTLTSSQTEIMQICWRMDPRDAHLGWRHTAGPTQHAVCLGSLWICKRMWHLATSKLEMSTELWMSSPLRRSQKVDGCRAADFRTALHAIQSREQFLEASLCPGTAWSQPLAFPSGPSSPVGLFPVLRGWQWLLT